MQFSRFIFFIWLHMHAKDYHFYIILYYF
uniref:Uncharacterized protein n=1 Tax=Arundo donax TaxID=35708 RepID=A0A0A8YGM0_ARUDO